VTGDRWAKEDDDRCEAAGVSGTLPRRIADCVASRQRNNPTVIITVQADCSPVLVGRCSNRHGSPTDTLGVGE